MSEGNIEVEIIPFRPDLAEHFLRINKQWIETMFTLEETDKAVLEAPQERVIQPGGKIWFAQHQSLGVIGTCALLKKVDSVFELTKMGVQENARGLKAGELLLAHAINCAMEMQVETLFLLTNKACRAAIHLYNKYGFRDDEQIMHEYGQTYARSNVAMRYFS